MQIDEKDHWPLDDTTVDQMRAAAKAWRAGKAPVNKAHIHDRIDDLINEIDRLRKG